MASIDEILNDPEESSAAEEQITATDAAGVETTDTANDDTGNDTTGETTQVAAEESGADYGAQVKAELTALAKERERIRQKEAALDEERQRLANSEQRQNTPETHQSADPHATLKELRKQYRTALADALMDQDDAKLAAKVDELEERMEAVRIEMITGWQRAATAQEQAANDFDAVFFQVHDEFPFLAVDHPQVNAELNDDINSYYEGRLRKGDAPAAALQKAVNRFAPAYAAELAESSQQQARTTADERGKKDQADKLIREKLSKSGFSEVRSASRAQSAKSYAGPTPMNNILGTKT